MWETILFYIFHDSIFAVNNVCIFFFWLRLFQCVLEQTYPLSEFEQQKEEEHRVDLLF